MKIRYMFQSTFRQILGHKAMFLLSLILMCLTFLVIGFQTIMVGMVIYQEHVVKELVQQDLGDVFFLNLYKYKMPTEEETKTLVRLKKEIEKVDGIRCSGICAEGVLEMGGSQETLEISSALLSLCELRNMEGDIVDFEVPQPRLRPTFPVQVRNQQEAPLKHAVLVGYNLKDMYPVGYSFVDPYTGDEYVVTDILEQGSRWIKDKLLLGDLEILLDNKVVIDKDVRLEQEHVWLSAVDACCYVIEPDADSEEIKKTVFSIADELGLDLYAIHSIPEQLTLNQQELFEDRTTYYMSGLMLLLSVIVAIVSSMINIYLRKSSIGIMYALGYSMSDMRRMMILENGIRVSFAFLISYTFWSINESEMFHFDVSIIQFMLPWLLIGVVIMIWISSLLPIKQLSRMYPATLIGGKE